MVINNFYEPSYTMLLQGACCTTVPAYPASQACIAYPFS